MNRLQAEIYARERALWLASEVGNSEVANAADLLERSPKWVVRRVDNDYDKQNTAHCPTFQARRSQIGFAGSERPEVWGVVETNGTGGIYFHTDTNVYFEIS